MYIILLSGGSGKRIWPLSNEKRSKQFIKLTHSSSDNTKTCSMLQRIWEQIKNVGLAENAVITTSKIQVESIKNQLGNDVRIAIEPSRRDTFAAIALSCSYIKSTFNADLDDYVIVVSVDTFADMSYFGILKEMEACMEDSHANIGLIGATPTYPSEKYGYILKETNDRKYSFVKGFHEKPNTVASKELINQGALWNCGVFCFKLKYLLPYFSQYNILFNYEDTFKNYENLPAISFDYEVVEKEDNLIVVPYDGFWKDIGTWNTLTDQMIINSIGNVVMDDTNSNTHIINELDIPILAMGTKDIIIAASYDGILVSDKYHSSFIKPYVEAMKYLPKYEEKRWGTIKVLDRVENDNDSSQTSKVFIFSGITKLVHKTNDFHLTIVVIKGNGIIEINEEGIKLSIGDTYRFNKFDSYSITALSDLEYVEIRVGNGINTDVCLTNN